MPITSMLIIAGIILMFVVFAAVLAWGEYQTRQIGRSGRQYAGASAQVNSLIKIVEDSNRGGSARKEATHLG